MARVDESSCSTATRTLAERLYGAYTNNSDGLNYQGLPCPKWDELPSAIRSHWCAVALYMDAAAVEFLAPPLAAAPTNKPCQCNPTIGRDKLCFLCGGYVG